VKGFTLIELLVVIAILGSLAAIGVPEYRNYRVGAQEKQAVNNLQSAALAQKGYWQQNMAYFPGKTADIDNQFFGGQGDLSQGSYEYEVEVDGNTFTINACHKNASSSARSFSINQASQVNQMICSSSAPAKKTGSCKISSGSYSGVTITCTSGGLVIKKS
jgi:prepilin-type N-terminal cleavage/methylation domain-containing protein